MRCCGTVCGCEKANRHGKALRPWTALRHGKVGRRWTASLGGLDAERRDFTVRDGVGDQHRLAANWAILDIGLLGYR
jgi:hypothetical protein